MTKLKKKNKRFKKIVIPEKIHEIISYLSFSFSSGVLERDDNKQFLYLKYIEALRRDPSIVKNADGWFFIKFKWLLLTRYQKEVKRIKREWEYKLKNDENKSRIQQDVGYLAEDEPEDNDDD